MRSSLVALETGNVSDVCDVYKMVHTLASSSPALPCPPQARHETQIDVATRRMRRTVLSADEGEKGRWVMWVMWVIQGDRYNRYSAATDGVKKDRHYFAQISL